MKSFYLYIGNENSGPFTIEELRSKIITRTTPVWREGMEDWKPAGDMQELNSLFPTIPPVIKPFNEISSAPKKEKKAKNKKILGLTKKRFFIVSGILLFISGILIANHIQHDRRIHLQQKNTLTEKNNQQYHLQQKQIETQKQRIAEQDRLEFERVKKERKQEINKRLLEVQNSISSYYYKLNQAKIKLNDTGDFQFLRTPDERNEEISLIQKEIESFKDEIEKLEDEKSLLYLQLEKIR